MKQSRTVLITGGSGFIGKHLGDYLKEFGYKVGLIPHEVLLNGKSVEDTIKETKPRYIFHLAAYGNHINQKDIDEAFVSNVLKTYTLFRAIGGSEVEAVINFSTNSVYGEYPFPLNENFKPMTESVYGSTKVCGEYLAGMFSKEYKKTFLTIRPFSVYGEGEADFRFIPTIIRNIVKGEEFELWPLPVHDWIYINDLVSGVMEIVDRNSDRYDHTIWNVASGVSSSNLEVVKLLEQISGHEIKYKIAEGKKRASNDMLQYEADISALQHLGWAPQYTLRQGLSKTYEWYKKEYGGKK